MVKELTVYNVSKASGGTPAVMNALIACGICTRKFTPVESGCVAIPLTEEDVKKLRKKGCVVVEAKGTKPQPQVMAFSIHTL